MGKYKIGDKVRIRKDLESDRGYNGCSVTPSMADHGGEVVTILRMHSFKDDWFQIKERLGECDPNWYWSDDMMECLVEDAPEPKKEDSPMRFKVGDRVKAIEEVDCKDEIINELGTIIFVKETSCNPYLVEFDNEIGGHDGDKRGKFGHCWWCNEDALTLSHAEPITPIQINLTVNINNYANSCWYCRKGGVVDLYFAGRTGICPSCKRVCNENRPTPFDMTPIGNAVIEFKPKKENEPLTTEELEKLPDGSKVFVVWCENGKGEPTWTKPYTCWRTKRGKCLERKGDHSILSENGKWYKAYLEEPERPS
jgi:hypothetical protein